MPACSLEREVNGSTALFRISGKFDGKCAWQLAGHPSHAIRRRLPAPRLPEGPEKGAAKEVV